MASLVLNGNVSGSCTITTPSAAGTTTLTLPTTSGTVLTTGSTFGGTGPAFSAYQSSAQTLSTVTDTKILFQTEEFDTNNNFASSRFTPTVAGYYQVSASIRTLSTTIRMMIWKNGTSYKIGTEATASNALVSTLVYCNGTTDYVEAYGLIVGNQTLADGINTTWFNGAFVRSA
jgi:hypothetical protein